MKKIEVPCPPIERLPSASLHDTDFKENNPDVVAVEATEMEAALAGVLEQYFEALDAGDLERAEQIMEQHPEISPEFRAPIHGLYLLGKVARRETLEPQAVDSHHTGQLGDFVIDYELGRGGMGIVYAATQISLRRRVALKVLPFAAILDPRQVARFQNEAQAAASLHHPNIVPVYAVGCERGVHYYCMQLIEGQSLEQFIGQLRPSSKVDSANEGRTFLSTEPGREDDTSPSIHNKKHVQRVVEFIVQAAQAIDFAHQHGIVHRDIKPSNLMLDRTGKVWVTDFGLARCRGVSNMTSQGDRVGTMRYMSPEQASGRNQQVDFRSDIYSLGVTLYELLTRKPAFDAPQQDQLRLQVQSEDPASLRAINPAVSIDLETIIQKAMSKEMGDRYSTATELADDLLRTLAGTPILARRPTLLDRFSKLLVRRKRMFGLLAAALLVFASFAAMAATIFYQQRQREQSSAAQAKFFLQQAHQAVSQFGGLMSDKLQQIPGTETLRAEMLGNAIGFYDDFLECTATADMKFQRAQALGQLGELYKRIGQDDLARDKLLAAIKEFRGLVSISPRQVIDQTQSLELIELELAVTVNRLGLLQKRAGEVREARKNFDDACEVLHRLSDAGGNSRNVEIPAALAQTLANRAMLSWEEGDQNAASLEFVAALETLEKIASSSPDFPRLQSIRCRIIGSYVAVHMDSDPAKAEALLRDGIATLEQLEMSSKADPHAVSYDQPRKIADSKLPGTSWLESADWPKESRDHLADMRHNLAVLLNRKGDSESGALLARTAASYWQEQVDANGLDIEAAESLASVQNTLGEIDWKLHRFDEANQSFGMAESLLQKSIKQRIPRPETLSRLGCVLHNRGIAAARENEMNRAAENLLSSINHQSKAIELAPENTGYRSLLQKHREALILCNKAKERDDVGFGRPPQ